MVAHEVSNKRFWASLLALGISSVTVQFVMIREIMSSFGGNELVIGLVLGMWLLFTGIGSAIGVPAARRWRPEGALFWGHLLLACLPFAQIAAVRALPLLWVRGEMLSLNAAITGSAALLVPFCIAGGAIIPVAGSLIQAKDIPARVFVVDTLGYAIGGLIFSLVLVYTLSHWDIFVLLGILNLFAASVMASKKGLPAVVILAIAMFAARPLDRSTLAWRFPGQELLVNKNTPFAQLTISRTGRQLNVFQDAIPLFSTGDLDMETIAHLPLCQVDEGARVLLIAGGVFGTLKEISRHNPSLVDYVELDHAIVDLDSLIHNSLSNPSVHVHTGDGRLFVKRTSAMYDAIIVDLPDPESVQLNRSYTLEFFEEARSRLSAGGVLSFTLTGSENYLEEKGLALNRSVYAAARLAFKHVTVFPGLIHYYLASDAPVDLDIPGVLGSRGITTERLVDYDLSALLDPFRMETLDGLLSEKDATPNRDLSPVAFGHLIDMWLKKSESSKALLYIVVSAIVLLAAAACRGDRLRFTVATSGYASMAFEVTLLILFQVIYGYVYLELCVFITLYMIGSALGAFVSERVNMTAAWQVPACDLALIVLAGLTFVAAMLGPRLAGDRSLSAMRYAVIPGVLFFVAFSAGVQFSAASRMAGGSGAEVTGRLYMSDLAGAACGTILTGLVFLPKLGMSVVLVSVAIIKGVSLTLNCLGTRARS